MLNPTRRRTDDDPISDPGDEAPLDAYSRAVATVVERVGPAVVRVESVAQDRWRGGVGSGVIIAGDGLVLTNSHVIGGAKRVRLAFTEGGGLKHKSSAMILTPIWPSCAPSLSPARRQQPLATRKFCGVASSSSRSATRSASSPRSRPGSSRRSGDRYAPKADD